MKITARAMKAGRYGWIVAWSDGAWTFEKSEADARTCVDYPSLCHPITWKRMTSEAEAYNRGYDDALALMEGGRS